MTLRHSLFRILPLALLAFAAGCIDIEKIEATSKIEDEGYTDVQLAGSDGTYLVQATHPDGYPCSGVVDYDIEPSLEGVTRRIDMSLKCKTK